MPEVPLDSAPTGKAIRNEIQIEMTRIKTLMRQGALTPDQVGQELISTVLPLLLSTIGVVEELEDFADWATKAIETGGGAPAERPEGGDDDDDNDDDDTQFTPEDAEKFRNYFKTVRSICEASLASLTPESEAAGQIRIVIGATSELEQIVHDGELTDEPEPEPGSN